MADTKWADIEADEDYEPEDPSARQGGFETKPDAEGIKTATHYYKNIKGETVKVVRKVKVIKRSRRVNRAVYERKELPKFGNSDLGSLISVKEDYFIEVPKDSKNASLKYRDDDEGYYFSDLQMKTARELRMKFKSLKEDVDASETVVKCVDEDKPAKYIPPSKRGDERSKLMDQQKDECTIRVTNLSEDVKEQDLTSLFGAMGRIHRIYLAKHKETKNSKGFAFITYHRKEDAVRCIGKLHRHGYDNLILNVEWAKPSNRDR